MSSPQPQFGSGISKVRRLRGISQTELGLSAGLSKATISQIETGRRGASEDSIFKICAALAVPVSFIAVLSDNSPNPIRIAMAELVQQFLTQEQLISKKDAVANSPALLPVKHKRVYTTK